MLKYIEEFHKYVVITGFRNVKIRDTEEFIKSINREKPSNVEIQVFNAGLVATWQHLYFAVLNALMVFRNKQSISRSLAMETMLYASAQGQIRRATEILGVKPSMSEVAAVIIGGRAETVESMLSKISKRMNVEPDDSVLSLTREKTENVQGTFGITETELQIVMKKNDAEKALVDLVIERMALLSTER